MRNLQKSKQTAKELKKCVFSAVPFREPILKSGHGSWVKDLDGNKYLDLNSGQFCLPLGHSNQKFNQRMFEQLQTLVHTNTLLLSEMSLRGAQTLCSICSKELNKVTFLSTGAEAVEFAIRHAKLYTKKDGIVALDKGYHGLTLGAQALSTAGKYAHPPVPYSYHIPTPDFVHAETKSDLDAITTQSLEKSREQLKRAKGRIAAFILEPVISVGGMIFPTAEYIQGLKALADEHEALLIFDECQTGLGRTGKWFGYEHFGVVPDLLVLAKNIGLGLPVSAVVIKEHIANALVGKIMHFSSHQNDPLAGMCADFLIKYMRETNLLEQIRKKGKYLLSGLQEIAQKQPLARNPRGQGLMLGFDLPSEIFKTTGNPGQELISLLEEDGVLIQATQRGRTFRILPNYLISKQEIDFFTLALEKNLAKLAQKYS